MTAKAKTKEQHMLTAMGLPLVPPATQAIRFILSQAPATLQGLSVVRKLRDDEGPLMRVKITLSVQLDDSDIRILPDVAEAVAQLVVSGSVLPKETKNQFVLSLGREFAGALYTLSGTAGRIKLNAQVDGTPRVKVQGGHATLIIRLLGVVRETEFRTLVSYLAEKPFLTVEPPQQEFDFEAIVHTHLGEEE